MNDLISLEELSDRLNIGKPTLTKMVKAGDLPYLRVGRTYRFDYEAVLYRLSNNLQTDYMKKKGN